MTNRTIKLVKKALTPIHLVKKVDPPSDEDHMGSEHDILIIVTNQYSWIFVGDNCDINFMDEIAGGDEQNAALWMNQQRHQV